MADQKLTSYEPIEPGGGSQGWGWLLKLALFVLLAWWVVQKAEQSPEIRQILEFLEEASGQRR